MKISFFILFILGSFATSTLKPGCNSTQQSVNNSQTSTSPNIESKTNTLIFLGKNYGLLYRESDRVFYFLQYEQKPANINSFADVSVVDFKGSSITLRKNAIAKNATVEVKTFEVSSSPKSSNIALYGLAKLSGPDIEKALLVNNSNGAITFNGTVVISDVEPEALKCGCYLPSSQNPPTCKSGGEGASSCSETHGGTTVPGRGNSCSISCGQGYFACCFLKT